jgi:signal transduction histidine kinase
MTSLSKAIAGGALLILVCIGVLSYWSEVWNEADREWVTHSLLVVERLQAIRIDITQAETGQRGYLLTGQDTYLALHGAGVDKLHRDITALRDLTSDNHGQQEAITRLEALIADRLKELSSGIEVRKQSGLMAGIEVTSHGNDGEVWMGLIARHIADMRETESKLLSARSARAAASTRNIKIIIAGGNVFAILALLINGLVIHFESVRRNLAERNLKHSNERLERRTAELSETNIELESFAYSVAHDLRAPLRHIAGFSGVLVQDYGPRFGDEGLRCLEKISEGAQKMGRLVDDLLSLSKIGRRELSLHKTVLDSLVEQVVDELRLELSGRSVEWQIGKLFSAECDPGLIKQVFVNLLSNAVKYTRKQEHAVIQVGQKLQDGERVIFIRDNGVGFEMKYASQLFGVFQRLHKSSDFEGTGVGLAIAQRIVRKHGGRIWVEAELNQGATFFFTVGSPERITNEPPEVSMNENEEEMHGARS